MVTTNVSDTGAGTIKVVTALKVYFERDDTFAPGGGRKTTTRELGALTKEERHELAALAAKELGLELEVAAS